MYRYDPFGRRILKTLTQQGADNANTPQAKLLASGPNTPNVNAGSTFYGYTDEGLVAEYQSNASGDMLAAYGYLPNQTWQTNPAYKRDVQTGTANPDRIHLFHNDHLGSPQRLTDSEGKTSWSASFESFGRGYADTSAGTTPAVTSSTPTANNHRFPGQYLDAETGVAQNYFRDYSAGLGRYGEFDPIGLKGGLNAYAYVMGAPTLLIDARGLDVWAGFEVGGSIGIVGVFSLKGGVAVNLQTAEVCAYTARCFSFFGVAAAVGAKGKGMICGPRCGRDLGGISWSAGVEIAAPGAGKSLRSSGIGGEIGLSTCGGGGISGGIGVGPSWGVAAMVGVEVCEVIWLKCWNEPCDCKSPVPRDCKK